jgi:copper chaperone CopZ
MDELSFLVPGMTCGHCVAAVHDEVAKVVGVTSVDVDLDSKQVVVRGTGVDRSAVWAAVDEAGYELAGTAHGS